MKKLLFLVFMILGTLSLSSQVESWRDFATYTPSCEVDGPIQVLNLTLVDFVFSTSFISFGGNPNPNDLIEGEVRRIVRYDFRNDAGAILHTVTFPSNIADNVTLNLTNTDLAGLPINTNISVFISYCYELVHANSNEIHKVTLSSNQVFQCEGKLQGPVTEFCCLEEAPVLCFIIVDCSDFQTEIIATNYVNFFASVEGNASDYSFKWTFTEEDTGLVSNAGNTQAIVAERCVKGIYCVTVTELATGCTEEVCEPYDTLPWDCQFCQIQTTVTGLTHNIIDGEIIELSWDYVPNAVIYRVYITFNASSCCPGNGTASQAFFSTTSTSVQFPVPGGKGDLCFAWRVIADCDGISSGSAESEVMCVWESLPPGVGNPIDERSSMDKLSSGLNMNIFPNPTSTTTTLTLENFSDESAAINVYSLEGRLMSSETVLSNQKEHTLKHEIGQNLPIGIYMVQVVSENVNISKKLIIQR